MSQALIISFHYKRLTKSESDSGHVQSFRRAIYPAKDILAGTVISEKDLITLRPCTGIGAEHYYDILNKKITVDIKKLIPFN